MKALIFIVFLLCPALAMAGGDDFISYLCTGGVKQAGNGFKVLRDGHVIRLLKLKDIQNPVEIPAGENADSATKLFDLAATNGFLDSTYDHGKCSITYHSPNKEHVVYYGAKAPKAVKDLFVELQTLHRSVVEKNRNSTNPVRVSP